MAPYYLVAVLGVAGVLAAGADVVIGHREVFVKATGAGAGAGAVPGPSSGVASSDAQMGTSKRPFRTLSEAVAAVRAMPAHQRCGLTVTIAAGVYGGAANVLRLTQEDSGCAGDPVVYRADPDAHAPVVLHGGAEIKPGDFKRAGKTTGGLTIWAADLQAAGLGSLATTSGQFRSGWVCANGDRTELFFGGRAMTLARHPNKKPPAAPHSITTPPAAVASADFVGAARERTWQYMRQGAVITPTSFGAGTDDTTGGMPVPADAAFLQDLGDEVWAHGFWSWDWADSFVPVKTVSVNGAPTSAAALTLPSSASAAASATNMSQRPLHNGEHKTAVFAGNATVELSASPGYGLKAGSRYVLLNGKSLLDDREEYYIDSKLGMLYFIPPVGADPSVPPVGDADGAFLSQPGSAHTLNGTAHVTLRSLRLEYAMGAALTAINVSGVTVDNCTLANSGTSGAELIASSNSSIVGSEVYGVGCNGVTVSGGDPILLVPSGLLVRNNSIHAFSRVSRTIRPGVSWSGCGITVSSNSIYDAPHSGIMIAPASDGRGVNSIFEDNDLHDLCQGTADAGGFYAGRTWANRGNVIRRNRFRNFAHTEAMAQATSVNGIYLDDMESGWTVEDNYFETAGSRCMFIGGGRQIAVRNNTFVNCTTSVHVDTRGLGWMHCGPNETWVVIALPPEADAVALEATPATCALCHLHSHSLTPRPTHTPPFLPNPPPPHMVYRLLSQRIPSPSDTF